MKCENCGYKNRKKAKYCKKCGIELPKKKKSIAKRIFKILLLLAFVLLLGGFIVPFLIGFFSGPSEEDTLIVYDETENRLVLYANQSTFYTGAEQELILTARVAGEEIPDGTYEIQDADGAVLTTFGASDFTQQPDGEVYSYSISVKESEPVSYEYSLVNGEQQSQPLSVQFIEPVTMEAMKECSQIGLDLADYIEEKQLEDEADETCLETVLEWLEQDARVLEAEINADSVLYVSRDHVAGIYTLPSEEGHFGKETDTSTDFLHSAKTANGLQSYLKSGTLPEDQAEGLFYIDGKQSITNTSWVIACSNVENGNDTSVRESHQYHRKFFTELCEKVSEVQIEDGRADDQGLAYIGSVVNRDLINAGVVVFISHGSYIRKGSGAYISIYQVYDWAKDNKTFEEAISDVGLQNENELLDYFYAKDLNGAKNGAGFFLAGNSICMTSNAYKRIYQNCFFDNTILYFGSCFGMLDASLSEFFLSHGARMTMGYETSSIAALESNRFAEKFNKLYGTDIRVYNWAMDAFELHLMQHISDGMDYFLSYCDKMLENEANILTWLFTNKQPKKRDVAYQLQFPDWTPGIVKWTLERGDDLPDAFRTLWLKQYSSYKKVRALAHGDLSGTVTTRRTQMLYDAEGNETVNTLEATPVRDVTLEFYQLLNQSFTDSGVNSFTEADGTFSVEDLRWGVYGIKMSGAAIADSVAGVTFSEDKFDGGTIEVNAWGASYTGFLMKKNVGKDTDSPVANAKVTFQLTDYELDEDRELLGSVYTATTDANGYFTIKDLPGGDYTITFTTADKKTSMVRAETLTNGFDYNYTNIYLEEDPSYYPFIHDELRPQLGMVSQDTVHTVLDSAQIFDKVGWSQKTGLLGADIIDFNQDGTEDLLLYSIEHSDQTGMERYMSLYVSIYSMDADHTIYLVTKERILDQLMDFAYERCRLGLMELDGKQYLYVEDDSTSYFANGGGVSYTWYYLTDDGTLRPRWKIGHTCGGSSCLANSLLDYYAHGEGEVYTLCTGGAFRRMDRWADYQGPSCDEYVLTADGEHRFTYPDEQVLQMDEQTLDSSLAFQAAFTMLGVPETAEYQSENGYDAHFGSLPTLWDTKYVKESISFDSTGTRLDGGERNMSVSAGDCTELHEKMIELDAQ